MGLNQRGIRICAKLITIKAAVRDGLTEKEAAVKVTAFSVKSLCGAAWSKTADTGRSIAKQGLTSHAASKKQMKTALA